jgi:hypothetical protein
MITSLGALLVDQMSFSLIAVMHLALVIGHQRWVGIKPI